MKKHIIGRMLLAPLLLTGCGAVQPDAGSLQNAKTEKTDSPSREWAEFPEDETPPILFRQVTAEKGMTDV